VGGLLFSAEGSAEVKQIRRAMEGLDMRTIAIINQKGGCGKTTTSINLAACLASLGQKTLLIDMDPQGHCGVGLAVPEEQIDRTIFDALLEPSDGKSVKLGEIVWQIATDFDLVPANIKLAGFEQLFAGQEGRDVRLRDALNPIRNAYKWCIIDCPPSVGLLTFNALQACDEAIVPVETGFFSLHGLSKMMQTLEMLKQHCGRELDVRILPTLYDTRTKLAREVLSELRGKFRGQLMRSMVNFNSKLKEAASFGQPITEYDPGSRGYKDFVNLARELMGHCPEEAEVVEDAPLSRPAELAKRAKQLSQLANYQFGRNSVATVAESVAAEPTAAAEEASARTTDRKIASFYGVKQIDEEVVFAARFNQARKVLIAGDFNNWSPMSTPMHGTDRVGEWAARLPLAPGRYRYRLVVDGRWMTDPNNECVEKNQFGELNNVIEVS
jgi:chromosome partitioning protein